MAPIAAILLDQRFVFSVIWGLGGPLRSKFHKEFSKKFRDLMSTGREGLSAE